MPANRLRKDGQPDRRYTRWEGISKAERSAHMAELARAKARSARADRIARLIEQAPPLTAEQKARLTVLLSGAPEAAAS